MVEAYRDRRAAEMREQNLRESMRLEYDETAVFEIEIRDVAYVPTAGV